MPFAMKAGDVLNDDNGIIHQQTECDHTAYDGELIQAEVAPLQGRQSHRETQRNGDDDNDRGTEAKRCERHEDEYQSDDEIMAEAADAMTHVGGLIKANLHAHRFRQPGAEVINDGVKVATHAEDVAALLHHGGNKDCRFAIVATTDFPAVETPRDISHVLEPHQLMRVRIGPEREVPQILNARDGIACSDVDAIALHIQRSAGDHHVG